jgi:hypothetical protein
MYIVIRVFNFQEKFSDRTKVGQETQTNVSEKIVSMYYLIVIDDTYYVFALISLLIVYHENFLGKVAVDD